MKIILLVEGARHTVDLNEAGTTIGRGAAADIRINSNAVSRVHARFFLKDEQVWVMDMKSLNGTRSLERSNWPMATPSALVRTTSTPRRLIAVLRSAAGWLARRR